MTNREFYTAVINGDVYDNEELITFAKDAIAKLDARNAKRASTPSKTQKENAPLIEKIASLLTPEPKLASELAKEMEISTQKASALVKKVEGVSVCDVKVKGKGTQKGYFFA
jgi:methylphosphotriester-DNA--protein-cysteine methyltransferase